MTAEPQNQYPGRRRLQEIFARRKMARFAQPKAMRLCEFAQAFRNNTFKAVGEDLSLLHGIFSSPIFLPASAGREMDAHNPQVSLALILGPGGPCQSRIFPGAERDVAARFQASPPPAFGCSVSISWPVQEAGARPAPAADRAATAVLAATPRA